MITTSTNNKNINTNNVANENDGNLEWDNRNHFSMHWSENELFFCTDGKMLKISDDALNKQKKKNLTNVKDKQPSILQSKKLSFAVNV